MGLLGVGLLVVGGLFGLGLGYVRWAGDGRLLTDGGRRQSGVPDSNEQRDRSGTGEIVSDGASEQSYLATWPDSDDGPMTISQFGDELEGVWSDSGSNRGTDQPDGPTDSETPVAAVWDDDTDIDNRYRTLTENFPEGTLALFDSDGHYLIAGGRLYDYIDHSAEDFVGQTIEESYVDEFVDRYGAQFYDVFEGRESSFEFRHGDRYFRKHLVPVWDGDTVDVGMEITKDITELRRREEALRESEQRYRSLAENFPHGSLALFDEDLRYRLVGGRLFDDLERDPEDFAGNTADDVYTDGFLDEYRVAFEQVFEGESSSFEFQYGDHYFRTYLVPIRDSQGRVEAGLDITEEITELREREHALEESEQRYRTLVESLPRGLVSLFDHDLRYDFADGGVFEYIDLDPSDFEGNRISDVHTDEYISMHLDKFRQCLEGEPSSFMITHSDRIYRVHLVPVRDEDGRVVRGMSISTDVTELKERERELERQNERLEDFVGIVSHDLRNPLQVLRGRLQLLEDEVNSEHLDQATGAVDRMDQLIDDMLALARQGTAVTDPTTVVLGHIARDAWGTADTGDATLQVDTGEYSVEADANRLRQLFENCYRNAVDHGPEDVTVTVGTLPDREGFFIADDGPGIPPEERADVLDEGYTTADDGTGFGLAIVSEIAEAHGWDVSVTDSDDGGARFEFETNPIIQA